MTQHWRYHVPSMDGSGWAIVYVDDAGALSVISDYGNFGHMWGTAGRGPDSRDFRDELLRFGEDYLLDKLSYGTGEIFDADATEKAVKEEWGDRLGDDLPEFEDEADFWGWCRDVPDELDLEDQPSLYRTRRDNSDQEHFMVNVWQRVRALIAADVATVPRSTAILAVCYLCCAQLHECKCGKKMPALQFPGGKIIAYKVAEDDLLAHAQALTLAPR